MISLSNSEYALLEALVAFNRPSGEGAMAVELKELFLDYNNSTESRSQLTDYLNRFKRLYILRFNFPKPASADWHKLIDKLGTEYIPLLFQNPKPSDVEDFANQTKNEGLSAKTRSNGYMKLTSFASKLAFTVHPNNFWIYDRTVKKSLGLRDNCSYLDFYSVCNARYDKFMKENSYRNLIENPSTNFKTVLSKNSFETELNSFRSIAKAIGITKEQDVDELLNKRFYDKLEMLNGGYNSNSLLVAKTTLVYK